MERFFWPLLSLSVALSSCGSLRYLTNVSVTASVCCSLFLGILTLVVGRRFGGKSIRDDLGVVTWIVLSCVWISAIAVCIATKGRTGLYSLNSQDVASHLAFMGGFIYKNGDVYHGFVSLYGLVGALVKLLHFGIVDALSLAIYSTLTLSMLLFTLTITAAVRGSGVGIFGVVVALVASTLSFLLIDLPLLFYNIGEGFWAHITSIIVLGGLWAGYTIVSSPYARVAIAVGSIALYRFSYGLNLGDLVATVALLTLFEARTIPGRLKAPMIAASLTLLVVGFMCYRKLIPLGELNGGIIAIDIKQSLAYSAAIVVGLAVALLIGPARGGRAIQTRFLLFPVIFCAVSMAAEFAYHQAGLPERYYSYKYGVHRVILLSLVAPLAVVWLLTWVRSHSEWKRLSGTASLVAVILVVFGSGGVYGCYERYRLGMDVFLTPPRKSFPDPLFSDSLVAAIQSTLAREGKTYHGTLARTWSGAMFLNVFMLHQEYGEGTKEVAENMTMKGLPPPPPSACVFWIRKGLFRTPPPLPLPELRYSMATFEARRDKTCTRHTDHIGKGYTLCYVCGDGSDSSRTS